MTPIIILFLVGILLLAGEVVVPGAIIGIIGALAMVAGCVLSFERFGTGVGLIASGAAVVLLLITLYVEFVLLPKTRFGKKLSVQATVDSTSQPPVALGDVIGKSGVAVTTLAPSGYVLIEGKRYEAFSQSGHVPVGALLRVVNLDNFRLIVSKS